MLSRPSVRSQIFWAPVGRIDGKNDGLPTIMAEGQCLVRVEWSAKTGEVPRARICDIFHRS